MSKSRGNVVDPWEVIDAHGADAFRWYYLTSQQPWAGYRFSAETIGESRAAVPADAVEHVLVSACCTRTRQGSRRAGSERRRAPSDRARSLGLSRGCRATRRGVARAARRLRLGRPPGRRSPHYVDELSNWYVRVSRRRFWDGDPAAFATLRHAASSRRRSCSRRSSRSPPTRSASTSPAAAPASSATSPTRSTSATSPSAADALRDPELEAGDGGRAPRGRARPRGPRPVEGEDAPAARARR